MTVLVLDKLWINRLDTGEAIAAISHPSDRSQQHSRQVTTREYASGRVRAISTGVAVRGDLTWRLVTVSQLTKDTLVSWCGIAVQVRDYRGQRFFGTFDRVDVAEYEQPGLYTAGFSLATITVVEGV